MQCMFEDAIHTHTHNNVCKSVENKSRTTDGSYDLASIIGPFPMILNKGR